MSIPTEMRYVLLAAINDGGPGGARADAIARTVSARGGTVRRYLRELTLAGDIVATQSPGSRAFTYTIAQSAPFQIRSPGVVRGCIRHMGVSGVVTYLTESPMGRRAMVDAGLTLCDEALVKHWRCNGLPAPIALALGVELSRVSRMSQQALDVDEAPVCAVIVAREDLYPWRRERAESWATAWQEGGAVMRDDVDDTHE